MATKKIRPGQSGENGDLRNRSFHIRLSETEYKEIEEQANLKRKSMAKFGRDLMLYDKNQISKVKPVLTNLSSFNYVKELTQLSKIGNNINQLAYRANKKEPITSLLNELVEQVTEFKRWRKKQINKGE